MFEVCKMCFYTLILLSVLGSCTSLKKDNGVGEISVADTEAVQAYRNGEAGKSLAMYKTLVANDPSNHVYLNNMGVLLLKHGQANEALKAFESASMRAPDCAEYLVNIGFAHLKLSELDKSMYFFDRAIQVAPAQARAYYGKGVVSLEQGEPEVALGAFQKAVSLNPADGENLFMTAYAEQKNGLWMDAVEGYSDYLAFGGSHDQRGNAYSNRALCYFKLASYDQGMADLQKAIELNDSNADYYYNRALGYQMQQRYEPAVDDYTRAISRKTDFPEALVNRGELHFLLGDTAKGCTDLSRACSMGLCGPFDRYEAAGKCE